MIRPAAASDAKDIRALWNALIRDTLVSFTTLEKTAQDVDQLLAARQGAVFVAEAEGRFAGFVTFGSFRAGPGYGATVEHSIMLTEAARGRGVGRALIQQAQAAARDMGHHVMVAGISGANPAAVAFHARVGFTQVGVMPQVGRKCGRWLDLVLMQKIL